MSEEKIQDAERRIREMNLDAEIIKDQGARDVILAGVIASRQGIERIQEYDPKIKIYAAVVDPRLNEKGYIMPGLGDAGDRCYGRKIEARVEVEA